MNYYGMPMLPSTKGLQVLFNYLEDPNSSGAEWILLDEELSYILYKDKELAENQYKEMAEQAARDFMIDKPTPAELASWLSFAVNAISVGISQAIEFGNKLLFDLCENVGKAAGAVVGGVTSGLSSGLFGNSSSLILILAIIVVIMFVI